MAHSNSQQDCRQWAGSSKVEQVTLNHSARVRFPLGPRINQATECISSEFVLSIGVSSSGRTADSGSAYGGSNPSTPSTSGQLTRVFVDNLAGFLRCVHRRPSRGVEQPKRDRLPMTQGGSSGRPCGCSSPLLFVCGMGGGQGPRAIDVLVPHSVRFSFVPG